MTAQQPNHARAVALFAGLATAFFAFAMQMQGQEQALSQATAKLIDSAEQAEQWRKENVVPDAPIRRAQRGMRGENALRAKLREVTRRQDRAAEMQKSSQESTSSSASAE